MLRVRLAPRSVLPATVVALVLMASAALADLRLLALMRGKAIIEVDGARHVLAVGETSPEGVTLIAADSERAIVERDGLRERLDLGVIAAPYGDATPSDAPDGTVTLWMDGSGFFFADGRINHHPVRFLVDTGASSIALSSETADAIGIDYRRGKPGIAETASGRAMTSGVKLDRVAVGHIVLYNIDASVVLGSYPTEPLLGATFLDRVDMVRDGRRMELRRRY